MNNEKIKIELTTLEVFKLAKALTAAEQLFDDDFDTLSRIKYRAQLALTYQRKMPLIAVDKLVSRAARRGFHRGFEASCAILEKEAVGKARNAA